jgi:TPR repeat protein
VGRTYFRGELVRRDYLLAFNWLTKASTQGHPNATFLLGSMHRAGWGTPQDYVKARELYEAAVAKQNTSAMVALGQLYKDGKGVKADGERALELFQQAADAGLSSAFYELGYLYAKGDGVGVNAVRAVEYYSKGAALGDKSSQFGLAQQYDYGEGVPHNPSLAAEYYEKAAKQGSHSSHLRLAEMYGDGEGFPKNDTKSFEHYLKAAELDDFESQAHVARLYRSGTGTQSNQLLAYAWMSIAAASQGIRNTKVEVNGVSVDPEKHYREKFKVEQDGIAKKLSAERLAEAQRLAATWKPGDTLKASNDNNSDQSVSGGTPTKQGIGTAFFVSKSGQAITNHHVIDGCKEVRVEGHDGVVKVSTSDVVNDLALLQVPGTVNAKATINADPAKLRQGDDIVVFGFPLNSVLSAGGNLTPGVVSALTGLGNNTNQIQITAAIQPGSSGSPVLNKKGEVVGVVSMKLSDSKMAKATGQIGQNVNFAVSGQTLKSFLDTHKVDYSKSSFMTFDKSTADLADEAKKWTTVVECWK